MPKHGFVIGWMVAWFLIGFWKFFVETKLGLWWNVAFFVAGLFLGTLVQTIWDYVERKRTETEGERE